MNYLAIMQTKIVKFHNNCSINLKVIEIHKYIVIYIYVVIDVRKRKKSFI